MGVIKATIFLFLLSTTCKAQTNSVVFPSDAEVRKILAERVKSLSVHGEEIGIVVGMIGPNGSQVISYGHLNKGDTRTLDGNTVFEIGSVTKVFTALLLADMVQSGEVALTDQVKNYLSASIKLPERNGHAITLVDLATHTSCLPFMPAAAINVRADLYKYLADYELNCDIGTNWDYSNFGYWLLSEAMASKAGMDYKKALRTRILIPLKLMDTDFELSAKMKDNLAVGHDAGMQPSPGLSTFPAYSLMPAAGSLYSTVNDLIKLLSTALGYEPSKLAPAMATSLSVSRLIHQSDNAQALGWTLIGKDKSQLIFRDGGTFGFASCIVFDPAKRVGVVVLSNHVNSVADIARHVLRPDFPLEQPTAVKHTEIKLDTGVLANYIGKFEAEGEGIFSISRKEDFLTIEAPTDWGLPILRIRPESATHFFATELPLRVVFQVNDMGNTKGILIYPPRGQKAIPAKKINK